MEKFVNYEAESEKNFSDKEVIKVTRRVLQQLVLWGFIAFNPLSTMDAKAQDINTKDLATSEKALSFESRFKNEGLLTFRQERHDKPTVVVTTRNNIEANYSGFIKTDKSLDSEELMVYFVNNAKIAVVERSSDFLQSIINEARLSEEGLVRREEGVKLGNWTPADYYVVYSIEKIGSGFIIKNEIIDMADGSSISVTVESPEEHSDLAVSELAQKTEKVIEQKESSKQYGQEE